ncbi:MAG: hypothetical protein QF415_13420 [Candidatus Undinarchaeales archaeon]|jgi:hypothetical protein|nr:hypothetical protein [Candidatus Undinarchaeales archaeon]MDP7494477.1 hypothetical protein [Candidatus Undinarchaeales archaeon]
MKVIEDSPQRLVFEESKLYLGIGAAVVGVVLAVSYGYYGMESWSELGRPMALVFSPIIFVYGLVEATYREHLTIDNVARTVATERRSVIKHEGASFGFKEVKKVIIKKVTTRTGWVRESTNHEIYVNEVWVRNLVFNTGKRIDALKVAARLEEATGAKIQEW